MPDQRIKAGKSPPAASPSRPQPESPEKTAKRGESTGDTNAENRKSVQDASLPSGACVLKVKLGKDGHAEVLGVEGPCGKVFDELKPFKRAFWLKKMTQDLRERLLQGKGLI